MNYDYRILDWRFIDAMDEECFSGQGFSYLDKFMKTYCMGWEL